MTADDLVGLVKEKGEEKATAWAESLLAHPALARLVQGIGEARVQVDRGSRRALHLFGLASRDDYRRASEVLARSGRKLTAVEMNLARIEVLLERLKAVPVSSAGPARVPAARPKPLPVVIRPATVKPAAVAAPGPTLVPASMPRTFAPPTKTVPAKRAAAMVKAPKARISDIALSGPAKASQLMLGFAPKAKRKR